MPAIYTNVTGLNPAICQAITNVYDDYPTTKKDRIDIGVSSLINPPRIVQLKKRHEYTVDVSDMIFILFGKLGHILLQRMDDTNALHEETITTRLNGWVIGGTSDRWAEYDEKRIIEDYKFTSLWSFIDGVKPEWKAQLEFYKWLYATVGLRTDRGRIWAFYRDWSKRKSRQSGYPPTQVGRYDIKLRDSSEIEKDILSRLSLHQAAVDIPDDELPECTVEERWEKPTTWAVMKKGRKSALRVLENEDAAEKWRQANGGDEIEKRPGESVRCIDYCDVMEFCNKAKAMGITPDSK